MTELAESCEIVDLSAHKQITDKLNEICSEVAAEPKTNGDRIRQMSDEELAEFFCQISQCCGNDASCSMCPIYDGCAQNVMCVERWLKQEAEAENNKTN